jgi:hypothetical protein
MSKLQKTYVILQDTREQLPWSFEKTELFPTVKRIGLLAGDYTVEGFEQIVAIDRKKSVSEFATNVSEVRWGTFLDKLSNVTLPYIVCEFSLDDILSFPYNSGVPKKIWPKLKATPDYLLSWIVRLSVEYGIHVIFAGDRDNAQKISMKILKKAVEKHV